MPPRVLRSSATRRLPSPHSLVLYNPATRQRWRNRLMKDQHWAQNKRSRDPLWRGPLVSSAASGARRSYGNTASTKRENISYAIPPRGTLQIRKPSWQRHTATSFLLSDR